MAVNALNLLASLRPWRSAGISHLLVENDPPSLPMSANPAAIELAEDRPDALPSRQEDGRRALADEAEGGREHPPGAASAGPPHPSAFPGTGLLAEEPVASSCSVAPPPLPSALSADTPRPSFAACRTSEAPGGDSSAARDVAGVPEAWPAPWPRLLAKAKPAPLLWSYAELAFDLLAPDEASASRSAVLRGMISELGLPKGTSTFWPLFASSDVTNPSFGQNVPFRCSRYFIAGLARLEPRVAVLFGPEEQADHPPIAPYTQDIIDGKAFVYLPSLGELAEKPQTQRRSNAFLRSILSQFPFPLQRT